MKPSRHPYTLDFLLNSARDNDEEVRIGQAYNLGMEGGVIFQQGRCKSGCRFWDGREAREGYQEKRLKYWPFEDSGKAEHEVDE